MHLRVEEVPEVPQLILYQSVPRAVDEPNVTTYMRATRIVMRAGKRSPANVSEMNTLL